MKLALLIRIFLVLCLFGVIVQDTLPLVYADPAPGYWSFPSDISGNISAENISDQPVSPANQSILPGDPLYALKLSFEQLDLSFTPNTTVRIEKSMHYTENRLVEADIAQRENRTGAADLALAQYSENLNSTIRMIATAHEHTSVPLSVHTLLSRHLAILNRTIARHPGSTDLLFAYNRTAALLDRAGRENSTPVHSQKTIISRKTVGETRSAAL